MQQFLNGTTDAKDVCTAMQNAYTAAGCLQEENIFSVTDNVNATDDALIDDFFENYELFYESF